MNETSYHQAIYDAAKAAVAWYGLERAMNDYPAWINTLDERMQQLQHALEGKE